MRYHDGHPHNLAESRYFADQFVFDMPMDND